MNKPSSHLAEGMPSIEIYTYSANPFRMGGAQHDVMKTSIVDYELVDIGKGYKGALFFDQRAQTWRIALVGKSGGGLIGAHDSKEWLLNEVREGVAQGDEELMAKQMRQSDNELEHADLVVEPDEFFRRFR